MWQLLLSVLFISVCVYWRIATKRPKLYPPGPKWYPIIGNTMHLRNETKKLGTQSAVFRAWKEKYKTSILGLKMGRELVCVALDYSVVHKIYTCSEFDGRPDNFFIRLRTMGSRLGITSTDGALWTEQRHFAMRHLNQYARSAMEDLIQTELNDMLQVIDNNCKNPVQPGKLLAVNVLNVLWNLTAGRKASNSAKLTCLLDLMKQRSKAFDMSGGWLNTMPFLRFIAPEKTSYNLIKRFNVEIYNFFKPIIDEHKVEFSEDRICEDLIFAFINEMRQNEGISSNYTDTQLIMVILDFFIAGAQTTNNSLDFILMLMVLHKDIQKKCHEEIDAVLGSDRVPSLKDKSSLTYIEAVILETQRLYSIIPVSGLRRVLKDTEIDGYRLPKNTTVWVGMEVIHMDTEYWGDPHVFRPERFLDANKNIINTERFITYGQGKRKCLGESVARASLFIFTVGILQKYNVDVPPNGKLPNTIAQIGLLAAPTPYELVFKRR